jgi:hypothetical protein
MLSLSVTDIAMQAGSYTNYFADALIAEAELDSRVVGIHAAMGGGTGMNRFEQRFPERTFDVGIAEQVWPWGMHPLHNVPLSLAFRAIAGKCTSAQAQTAF